LKKIVSLLLVCIVFSACSKSPGSQETGYRGAPWGADADAVAKKFTASPKLTRANSLFGSDDETFAPRAGALLGLGFSKLLTGEDGAHIEGIAALKGMSILPEGQSGYSLFFNKKYGMSLDATEAKDYKDSHDKLMKRYGVIDKKVEYLANQYESSYLIMWHNADGVIILAKERYFKAPSHQLTTSTQIIHMDKHILDAISSDLKNKQG
jgi:hypothetical protein